MAARLAPDNVRRMSTETMRANQMRLYLSAMAYILVSGLRRVGLQGTELEKAQVSTIRAAALLKPHNG
jgi:DDE family transposase